MLSFFQEDMNSNPIAKKQRIRGHLSPFAIVDVWLLLKAVAWRRAAIIFLSLLSVHQVVDPQKTDAFGVDKLVNDVTKRFKLSSRDVKSIRPLIVRANQNVFEIYVRFSGDEPEYSDRVWDELIARRRDFDESIKTGLTARQRSALREARNGMERRVLNFLVEDYVHFLAEFLELRDREFEMVQDILQSENGKKYQIIITPIFDSASLQRALEAINQETERQMRSVLSGEQWRDYYSLTEPVRQIA